VIPHKHAVGAVRTGTPLLLARQHLLRAFPIDAPPRSANWNGSG
jgi:hypothetical protein